MIMQWNRRLMAPDPAPAGGGPPTPPTPPPQLTAEQQEILRLRNALAQRPQAPQQPAPGVPDKQQLESAFWKDPLSVSAAIATQAAQAASMNGPGLDTMIEMAKERVRSTDVENFDKYYGEIEQYMQQANLGPQFRANVNVWRNAFDMVRGKHVHEIIAAGKGGGAPAIHRGDGPAPSQPAAPPAAGKPKLTEDESRMARNLGISEDGYRHGKEIMEKQDGRDQSPWDAAITIDTAAARRASRQAAK